MTKEELLESLLERGDETVTLRQLVERFEAVEEEYSGMPWTLKQIYTQIDMLVSEKPCGDCISREAVMHILDEVGGDFDSPREAVVPIDYIADMVAELPPVTAQPKMGYWLIDERPESDREVVCSNCDKPIFKYHKLDFDYRPKYCPNCGAKM